MKSTFKLMILSLIFCMQLNLKAQVIQAIGNSPFIGTWEYKEGNEIFRVLLWQDEDGTDAILGHYEKVTSIDGQEQYIYCSDKEKFVGSNKGWLPFVMWLEGNDSLIGGAFIDNTVNENLYSQQKSGGVGIEILPNNDSEPLTAKWKVKRSSGPYINEAPEFSVPTDIILTKVD